MFTFQLAYAYSNQFLIILSVFELHHFSPIRIILVEASKTRNYYYFHDRHESSANWRCNYRFLAKN